MAKRKKDTAPYLQYCYDITERKIPACRYVIHACQRHLDDLENGQERGLYFDEGAAKRAINFIEFLKHVEGEWAAKGLRLKLEPWQQFIVASIFGWKRTENDKRRFRNAYIEVPRKNAKALALDTRIPTPKGWSTMGSIKVGDYVLGADGKPCKVIAESHVFTDHECYELTFSTGDKVIADAGHLWVTDSRSDRDRMKGRGNKNIGPKPSIKTTEEIAKTLKIRKENNHRIKISDAVRLPEANLPVPPYALGAWLGDGHSASARLTCAYKDIELANHVEDCGISIEEQKSPNVNSGLFLMGRGNRSVKGSSMQEKLKALELINNKHIPIQYLRSSYEQRTELLKGLMDTDGTISKSGQCSFTSTCKPLFDGVIELIASLGFKPSVDIQPAVLNGKECGTAYRVQFWAYNDRPVFNLARKRARQKEVPTNTTRTGYRQIVSAKKIESVPVKCIAVDNEDHQFLIGEAFIPTHNSTLAAAIKNYMFLADNEHGAQCYSAAKNQKQASIVFNVARQQMNKLRQESPAVKAKVSLYQHTVFSESNFSKMEAVSSEASSLDGKNSHCTIVDEYHAHPNADVYNVMKSSSGSRSQPLLFTITTAGFNKIGPCYQLRKSCIEVLEGKKHDDGSFYLIYTLDPEDDWNSPDVWIKSNPNWGVSVYPDYIKDQYTQAVNLPSEQVNFKTKHLNLWTDASEVWIPDEKWMACNGEVTEQMMQGRTCFGGLDLASKIDITALVLVFPDENNSISVLPYFWIPEETVRERSRRDGVPYEDWVREGWIYTTPGKSTDYDFIRAKANELAGKFNIEVIGYDDWNAGHLINQLTDDGANMKRYPQGIKHMSEPTKELEKMVIDGHIKHGGNPVLRWMCGNVELIRNAEDSYKIDKDKSSEKVDGMVALVMGIGEWIASGREAKTSPFIFTL